MKTASNDEMLRTCPAHCCITNVISKYAKTRRDLVIHRASRLHVDLEVRVRLLLLGELWGSSHSRAFRELALERHALAGSVAAVKYVDTSKSTESGYMTLLDAI